MYEIFSYHPEHGLRTELSLEELTQALIDERSLLWVDFSDVDDDDIDLLTMVFNLHTLTVEDFIMPNVRPKVEQFQDYLFLIMFALEAPNNHQKGKVRTVELDFCLGKNFVITFHSSPIGTLTSFKERIKKQSPIIKHSADMLLYYMLDSCIEAYFPVITEFDNLVDEMSDELFKDPTNETLKKIYHLKNEVMLLRRTIGPQADAIGHIAQGEHQFIASTNTMYFRNIHDNLLRLNDIIGTSRDIITGAMEAYVSVVSNRLNEIMKTLTVIATIMMPLTLIASIYGMNFRHMPELGSKFGYPAVLMTMLVIAVTMIVYFKQKKWL